VSAFDVVPRDSDLTVKRVLRGVNERHPNYPLIPGDIIHKDGDGTYWKSSPGLMVGGFTIEEEDIQTWAEYKANPPSELELTRQIRQAHR
jgi:hypothetical protein